MDKPVMASGCQSLEGVCGQSVVMTVDEFYHVLVGLPGK